MKHKAKLNISRPSYGDDRRKIAISVIDTDAGIEFLELEIDLADFAECVTGLSHVECEMEFRGLENLGKVSEKEKIEFKVSDSYIYKDRNKEAIEKAKLSTPPGWEASEYYGSQNSFFTKGDEMWARTTITRWVDKEVTT